jgi:uncharacterized protein
VLCVLSQANVEKPKELYRFFKGLEWTTCVHSCRSSTGRNADAVHGDAEQYGRFLTEIFDLWWPERRKMRIRFFDNVAEAWPG